MFSPRARTVPNRAPSVYPPAPKFNLSPRPAKWRFC
jgi:hypothetical protein